MLDPVSTWIGDQPRRSTCCCYCPDEPVWQWQCGRANAQKRWEIRSIWVRCLRLSLVVFDTHFVNHGPPTTWHRLSLPTADRRCRLLSADDDGCRHALTNCHRFSDVDEGCFWLDVVVCKLPPCHHVSYQYSNRGASTERRGQFLQTGYQPSPTNSVTALKAQVNSAWPFVRGYGKCVLPAIAGA